MINNKIKNRKPFFYSVFILSLILILPFEYSCNPKAQKMKTSLDIQGHRGCRGLRPENSIPAFIKAIEIGVNTLELDVVVNKDLDVIVSHEPFFNHEISTGPGGKMIDEESEKDYNMYPMPGRCCCLAQ